MTPHHGLQQRRTNPALTSASHSRARNAVTPYSALVRNFDALPAQDPLCEWEWMFDLYPMNTDLGRELRRAVSEEWLRRLADAEMEIAAQAERIAAIADRTERIIAESKLRMACVVHFGVAPEEFAEFERILKHNIVLGQLTIREAATTVQLIGQRNGDA